MFNLYIARQGRWVLHETFSQIDTARAVARTLTARYGLIRIERVDG